MNTRLVLSILYILISFSNSFGQENNKNYPVIGQPCPYFEFNDVTFFKTSKVNLGDFKGEYFILDFWAKTCTACIASFPHTDRIQQKFGDQIVILPVGAMDKQDEIRPLFKKIRETRNLTLPCAFDSLVIFKFVPDRSVPNLVWIDKNGIVQAVTSTADLNEYNVNKFINGAKFSFVDFSHEGQLQGDNSIERTRFFSENGNLSDSTNLYKSQFSLWKLGMGNEQGPVRIDEQFQNEGNPVVKCYKYSLPVLYSLAYFGVDFMRDSNYYGRPILEIKDSSNFYQSISKSRVNYCYSLQIPKRIANKRNFMRIMQGDLNNYFNYDARIEDRDISCLFLVVTNKAKANRLISNNNGGSNGHWQHVLGGELNNITIGNLIAVFMADLPDAAMRIYDRTSFYKKINFKMNNANTADLKSLRPALNKMGFDLIEGKRRMKTLVIRDRN